MAVCGIVLCSLSEYLNKEINVEFVKPSVLLWIFSCTNRSLLVSF